MCLESRLFRAAANAARRGKWEVLSSGSTVDREDGRERETAMTRFRWRGGKKDVDALRISDHNLISLLLTTQRC
ncbi:enoyl-CoA hydratase [Burkholderia humptydooensis]|nr:enoyl-CoA hydratase [Burkholderia humptydooensis]